MTEYTPDTKQVRLDYAYLGGTSYVTEYDQRTAEFDRWLAAHARAIKAEAFDEGVEEADDATANTLSDEVIEEAKRRNPYRDAG